MMMKVKKILSTTSQALLLFVVAGTAIASTAKADTAVELQTPFYDPSSSFLGSCFSTGSLERFLQTQSYRENQGDPNLPPKTSGGASGKYQYIKTTWQSSMSSYYNPVINGQEAVDLYPEAYKAPENVQDAVAYLKYAAQAIRYKGNVWEMSIVHYYPAALENLNEWMDKIPRPDAGNTLTIREYANNMVDSFNRGDGKNIKISAKEAPDFTVWLKKDQLGNVPQLYAVENNGSPSASIQTDGIQTCGGNVAIVQTALNLSWPDSSHGVTPKPEYQRALNQVNPLNPADCGVFVATVMRYSGADLDYPPSGTSTQAKHLKTSGKYKIINADKISDLQPGDILVIGGDNDPGSGHTFIYVGNQPGGANEASASYNSRAANLDKITSLTEARGTYMVARLIQ